MRQWNIAIRSLSHRPGFTLSAILILALGVGANTTLFSLVDTVLLKPLPYPHSGRLVTLLEASPAKNEKDSLIAPARLEDWQRMSQTFETISGSYAENVTELSGSEPERLNGRRVAPRFFDVYRTPPVAGRTFNSQEDNAGGPLSAVISYGFWTRRFAQAPDVTSKRLLIGGKGYSIVGVMPQSFSTAAVDVWIPAQTPPFLMRVREARFYTGVGRMRPGVTIEQASADLARVESALGEQFPASDKGWSAKVGDLKEARVGDYRRTLFLVFGAVGMLLLIAVTNVAGLVLAQLQQRSREMAIRSSLGASRAQVVGTVMREVLLISAAGAFIGGVISWWSISLTATFFKELPRAAELHFDWRALAFTVAASLLGAILFGLPPALQATQGQLAPQLAASSRSVAGGSHRWQQALLVTQVAITVLLLSSAGLLLRTYRNLSRVDVGFNPAHTLTFHVGAAWDEDRTRVAQMQVNLVDELQRMPGIQAAGLTNFLPASGASLRYEIQLEGQGADSGKMLVGTRTISSGYLKAMDVPLLAGAFCPALSTDQKGGSKVIVNRRFVEMYGKGNNLVGRHLQFAGTGPGPAMEIAGVVGDVREDSLSASAYPYVYGCFPAGTWPDPEYVVRAQGDPRSMAASIRALVHTVEPTRAVFGLQSVEDVVSSTLEQPRLSASLLSGFAAAAMLLASIGLYGLISLLVASRTREIGIRIALGAQSTQVMRSVFLSAGRLLAFGIAAGALLAFFAARLLRTVVFGVGAFDLLTLVAAVLVLVAVSTAAALVPARRAARIDPIIAMRAE